LCKICEKRSAILNRKYFDWLEAQSNSVALMEREVDPQQVYQAYDLLKTDPADSFRQFLALAESGSVWSMAMVGRMFESSEGTERDLVQAEEWYLRAYRAGSDYGLIWLGLVYLKSNQLENAINVFRTGVDRGFAPAMYHLAWSYWKSGDWPRKQSEAMSLLQRGFAAGDLSAGPFLAHSMARGRFGWRHVLAGLRLSFKVADAEGKVIEDDQASRKGSSDERLGFFGRLATSFWTASQAKVGVLPKVDRTSWLSAGS
jgi:TPR repeat protein